MSETTTTALAATEFAPMTGADMWSDAGQFELAQRMALALGECPFLPRDYQGKQNIGSRLIALDISRRTKLPPLMVMQQLTSIHGKPTWSAQMVHALTMQTGRFEEIQYEESQEESEREFPWEIWERSDDGKSTKRNGVIKLKNKQCRAFSVSLKSRKPVYGPWVSLEMAIAEGWYTKNGSKWKTMPDVMLRYRAITFFGRSYAPDALMGLRETEEARDIGPIVDIETVQHGPGIKIVPAVVQAITDKAPEEPRPEPPPSRTKKDELYELLTSVHATFEDFVAVVTPWSPQLKMEVIPTKWEDVSEEHAVQCMRRRATLKEMFRAAADARVKGGAK